MTRTPTGQPRPGPGPPQAWEHPSGSVWVWRAGSGKPCDIVTVIVGLDRVVVWQGERVVRVFTSKYRTRDGTPHPRFVRRALAWAGERFGEARQA